MTNRFTKYGFMIIAAVLLAGVLFAGAASAADATNTSISSWAELKENITAWNEVEGTDMLTIVLSTDIESDESTSDFQGIPIYSNITIIATTTVAGDYRIDGKGTGRIFNIEESGNLTLRGSDVATLNLTGGRLQTIISEDGSGSAVRVQSGGKLTLAANATIFNCSAGYGGGAVYNIGTFAMAGGRIVNCTANKFGGGVYNNEGTFTMSDTSIIEGCRAGQHGGGVSNSGTFTMAGGSIRNCTADLNGGGVSSSSDFVFSGGTISGNKAGDVGSGIALTKPFTVTGTAELTANNDVALFIYGADIMSSINATSSFTGHVRNITLYITTGYPYLEDPASWVDCPVVTNVSSTTDPLQHFNLSTKPLYDGYTLAVEGTNLILKSQEYSITYNLDGGTNASTNPATYNASTLPITLADASKKGYTFEGWYNSSVFIDANRTQTIPVGSTGDKEFWANYTANTTEVTFHNDSTTAVTTFTFDQSAVAVPGIKRGHVFTGWFDEDGIEVFNETGSLNTSAPLYVNATDKWGYEGSALSLWANYTANVTTVTFYNETGSSSTQFTFDQTAEAAVESKTGHTFAGWFDGSETNVFDGSGNLNTSASGYVNATDKWGYEGSTLSLWANFTINHYNVTFNPDNGTTPWNVSVEYNKNVTAPANPTKDGYTFNGWNESNAAGTPFDFTTLITKDTRLVANYTANTYNITYIQPEWGYVSGAANATCGSTVTVTAMPDDGYRFKYLTVTENGSSTAVSLTGTYSFTMPAFDVNVTATFEKIPETRHYETQDIGSTVILENTQYQVNFNMNGHGVQVTNQTVVIGSSATEPYPVPTADGFVFRGWYSDKGLTAKYAFSTPVYRNTELYAGWTEVTIQPVDIPTQQTSKSPAPFVGLIAGLGAAAVLLRMRK